MQCRRCDRFMTVDGYIDMGNRESPLWLRTWRCGTCGQTDGPEIFLKRAVHRNWVYRALKRWTDTRPPQDELLSLNV